MHGHLAAAALAAILITGCSSDSSRADLANEDSDSTSTPSALEPTTETASADPVYVESATCRRKLAPLLDIADANAKGENLSFRSFEERVIELTRRNDHATLSCSGKVMLPWSKAMYKYAQARLYWGLCPGANCDIDKVTRQVIAGNEAASRARTALEATE